jgi:hypothetical protein
VNMAFALCVFRISQDRLFQWKGCSGAGKMRILFLGLAIFCLCSMLMNEFICSVASVHSDFSDEFLKYVSTTLMHDWGNASTLIWVCVVGFLVFSLFP